MAIAAFFVFQAVGSVAKTFPRGLKPRLTFGYLRHD